MNPAAASYPKPPAIPAAASYPKPPAIPLLDRLPTSTRPDPEVDP